MRKKFLQLIGFIKPRTEPKLSQKLDFFFAAWVDSTETTKTAESEEILLFLPNQTFPLIIICIHGNNRYL